MKAAHRRSPGPLEGFPVRLAAATAIAAIAIAGCRPKEPPPPPPFTLESVRPALDGLSLDDAFLAALKDLKAHAAGDPALAAAHVRYAVGGLAAGLATGQAATARLAGGTDAAAIRAFLDGLASGPAVAASLKDALASASSAFGPGRTDLAAAIAYATSSADVAPALRVLMAARLLDGLRAGASGDEAGRGARLRAAIPGLPAGASDDAFAGALGLLSTLLAAPADPGPALAGAAARIASGAADLLGARAWATAVSGGPGPRPAAPASGVASSRVPLEVLTLRTDGLAAGMRPVWVWQDGKPTDLAAGVALPGAIAVPAADLDRPSAVATGAAKDAIARIDGIASGLTAKAYPGADADAGPLPVALASDPAAPAARLKAVLDVAKAAGRDDLRLLPYASPGRVLPVFHKGPRALPDAKAPKGPRVLVVLVPGGADAYPPAKPTLPPTGWPDGVLAVPDGKALARLSVPWTPEAGFGGALARAVGALREKLPGAVPVVDVVIRSKDTVSLQVVDAAAEIVASPGAPAAQAGAWFPGLDCGVGEACPSAFPALFSDAPIPKPAKAPVVMAETRPSGFCDKAAVQRVIMGRSGAYRACYEAELQRYGSLEGRLELRFTIEPDGSVSGVTTMSNDLNRSVEACIVRQVSQLKFTKPDGGICIIRWPFRFQPGG